VTHNPHIVLGDPSYLHQYGIFVLLLQEYTGAECAAYDDLDWQILLRDMHDLGDLAVKRRDTCNRIGWGDMAVKWHNLSIKCAEVVEDFIAALGFLLPDISQPTLVVWN